MKATIVTYADEFAKREVQELAKAAGHSVQDVIGLKQIVKSGCGVGRLLEQSNDSRRLE